MELTDRPTDRQKDKQTNKCYRKHNLLVGDNKHRYFHALIAEKLAEVQIRELPEVIQSEMGQKQKLKTVLDMINKILQHPPNWNQLKWSVDRKHSHNQWYKK